MYKIIVVTKVEFLIWGLTFLSVWSSDLDTPLKFDDMTLVESAVTGKGR